MQSKKYKINKYRMNHNFRQMQQQYNNNFINGYQHHVNNNTPFANNPMLTTNPIFQGSIRDSNFQTRANIAKLEQRKRIRSINELGMSSDQILNYIIDPIKVVKQSKEEFQTSFDERSNTYINPKDLGQITRTDQSKLPKWLKDIYAGRKNTPYKSILRNANILKKEQYERDFKDEAELLIHKVTQLDKDEIRFIQELAEKLTIFEEHDGELKLIYSASKEAQFKKDFEYVQKYKHRSGYNPEDYTDLKKYYKKEQKRINRENKRIDEMVEVLLMSDQISKEDLEKLQSTVEIEEDKDDTDMNEVFKQGEKELEKKLEKELRAELGDEQFEEIMNQLNISNNKSNKSENESENESDNESDNQSKNNNESEDEIIKPKRVKIKEKQPEKKPSKVKIRVKEIEKPIGKIENADLEKYKNRKKKI